MKILRVCYEYPPPWDGLTPGPFELSLAQVEEGHEVLYFAGGRPSDPVVPARGIRVRRLGKSWPTFLFGPFFSFDVLVAFYIRAALKRERFDVLHVHGNTALWISALRLLGLFKGMPYVYHAHASGLKNFRMFWPQAGPLMRIKALFIWTLLVLQDILTVKAADGIIAVSARDREIFVRSYGCPEAKIIDVENGVNTALFQDQGTRRGKDLRLIIAGILRPAKNIEKIISVVSDLARNGASPVLTIVGRGEDAYISKLKELAEGLGITDRIRWRGYVPYPQLPGVYGEQDILLLFSHAEGLPKVVLEAVSCGLRVVSTRSFAITGYLNDIVEWVEENEDEHRTAAKILGERERPVDREKFLNEYSWRRKAEEVSRFYEKLLRPRRGEGRREERAD